MTGKASFRHAETLPSNEVADHLTQLAHAVRSGFLSLRGSGQSIALDFEPRVKLEVQAQRELDEGELRLEVSWTEGRYASAERLEVTVGCDQSQGKQTQT